ERDPENVSTQTQAISRHARRRTPGMSNFLFRMVERAAGLSAATSPQPPRPFQWPAPAETPYPGKSTFDSFQEFQQVRPISVRPSLPLKPLATGRIEQRGQGPDIQIGPKASSLQPEADVNKQAVKHSNDRLRQDAEQ